MYLSFLTTKMNIHIVQGPRPPLQSPDIIIVVDVIRAFTSAHVAFTQGVRQIYLVDSISTGLALKSRHPEFILAGESNGLPIPGFDLSNSPFQFSRCNFRDKTLILKTTHGTEAALHAFRNLPVFVVGFINAKKTADWIRTMDTLTPLSNITIIASHPTSDEDLACAEYIRGYLTDHQPLTAEEVTGRIHMSACAKKFHDPSQAEFDARDLDMCARESPSPFVLRVVKGPYPSITRGGE